MRYEFINGIIFCLFSYPIRSDGVLLSENFPRQIKFRRRKEPLTAKLYRYQFKRHEVNVFECSLSLPFGFRLKAHFAAALKDGRNFIRARDKEIIFGRSTLPWNMENGCRRRMRGATLANKLN